MKPFAKNTTSTNTTLFDVWFCLRAYPEFRPLATHILLQNKKESLTPIIQKAFVEKYPNKTCTDPDFDASYYCQINSIPYSTYEEAYTHWITYGKQKGLPYAPLKSTSLKIILKTHNEDFFIEEWIEYHKRIVGLENILILDHSSTSEKVHRLYKKYESELCVISIPRTINHDFLHNMKKFPNIFDTIKQECLFFTFIDTDEFLCRFNGNHITAKKIPERIRAYESHKTIGTTWLVNYFSGTDAHKPSEAMDFNMQQKSIRHNIWTGKTILRNDTQQEFIAHNRLTPNVSINAEFFLLHIKRANITARIEAQRNACVGFGIITETDDAETIIKKITAINPEDRKHPQIELLTFLLNTTEYRKSMIDIDEKNILSTNVLSETLYGTRSHFELTLESQQPFPDFIKEQYIAKIPDFEKWQGSQFIEIPNDAHGDAPLPAHTV